MALGLPEFGAEESRLCELRLRLGAADVVVKGWRGPFRRGRGERIARGTSVRRGLLVSRRRTDGRGSQHGGGLQMLRLHH